MRNLTVSFSISGPKDWTRVDLKKHQLSPSAKQSLDIQCTIACVFKYLPEGYLHIHTKLYIFLKRHRIKVFATCTLDFTSVYLTKNSAMYSHKTTTPLVLSL